MEVFATNAGAQALHRRLTRDLWVKEVDGGVFMGFWRALPSLTQGRGICFEENEFNHFHFDDMHADNAFENYCVNRSLADSICNAVRRALNNSQVERPVQLFVLNELTDILGPEEDGGRIVAVHLYPTLRLWSPGLPGDSELRSVFLPDHQTRDTAWLRYRDRSLLLPVDSLNFSCPFLGLESFLAPASGP